MCISALSVVSQPTLSDAYGNFPYWSGSYWVGEGQVSHGIFEYGGKLYLLFFSNGAYQDYVIYAKKSEDGGNTWATVPSSFTGNVPNIWHLRANFTRHLNKIYFAYTVEVVSTGAFLQVGSFDLETEQFNFFYSSQGPQVAAETDFNQVTPVYELENLTQCVFGDRLIIAYCDDKEPGILVSGQTYFHPKFAFAVFDLNTLLWSTADPVTQADETTYGVFKLIPSENNSLIHCIYWESEFTKTFPVDHFNDKLKHIALNPDLTLAGAASLITEDHQHNFGFGYDASQIISYNDGTDKLAFACHSNLNYQPLGGWATTWSVLLFSGDDSVSPNFTLVDELKIEDLGLPTNSVFSAIFLNYFGQQSIGIGYIDNALNIFVGTYEIGLDNDWTFLTIYKVKYLGGGNWEKCPVFVEADRTELYDAVALGYSLIDKFFYLGHDFEITDTSFGKFLTFGIFDENTLNQSMAFFYAGLLEASTNLSVIVDDRLSLADDLPRVRLSTPGQGIVVHTCPDIIVASEFCSFVKTSNDDETQLHDCEEQIYTENTDPC